MRGFSESTDKKRVKLLRVISDMIEQYQYVTLLESVNLLEDADKLETYKIINEVSKQISNIFFLAQTTDDIKSRFDELLNTEAHNLEILQIILNFVKNKDEIQLGNDLYIAFHDCESSSQIQYKILSVA